MGSLFKIPENLAFLILDDMESMRSAMEKELKGLGFLGPFFKAMTISQAMHFLSSEKIDFILSDWNLDGEFGVDFLKKVRSFPQYSDMPFVMVTTEDDVSKILEAVRLGASNYIVKPWEKNDFHTRIKTAWEKHKKNP